MCQLVAQGNKEHGMRNHVSKAFTPSFDILNAFFSTLLKMMHVEVDSDQKGLIMRDEWGCQRQCAGNY